MAYDNTNTGKIWKSEKRPGKNDPDYTIELNFQGLELRVPIWKRREDANPKAPPWSFKIELKDADATQPVRVRGNGESITEQALAKVRRPDPISSGRSLQDDMDDDIPFAPEWR
jgi:hypothetical protein